MGESIALSVEQGARFLVAGAFVLSAVVALTHWAVRRGSLQAFGAWPRLVRRWSDPVLRPVERRLARAGGNPQDAPIWLVGIVVVAGLATIALVDWLIGFAFSMVREAQNGFLAVLVIHTVFQVLRLAILILVVASWLGISPYSKPMRLVHALTDWLVDPIRRVVPNIGMFDISPLVAYFVLYLAETVVMRGLF